MVQHGSTTNMVHPMECSRSSQRILLWKPYPLRRVFYNSIQSNCCTYKITMPPSMHSVGHSPVPPLQRKHSGPSTSRFWLVYWVNRSWGVWFFFLLEQTCRKHGQGATVQYHDLSFFCWDGRWIVFEKCSFECFRTFCSSLVYRFALLLACGHNTFYFMKHVFILLFCSCTKSEFISWRGLVIQ